MSILPLRHFWAQFRPTPCCGLCRTVATQYMWASNALALGPTPNAETGLPANMEIYPWEYFHFCLIFGYA